ncbi:hypothetical protein [Endozoicomonas sp. SCSIO W0465]|uniref:hypothetical protein n=1 Tax=Endozoicomonas sp. SCSIO W0465 TaxID=2918516 RepID=UPI0020750E65|nr:hypothetical protein [Endozoicomonas sp. SCSIO W0465]USE37019.1 hypothetical protein MJO57_01930 [Endozoicomonas sp. SCSIO W0465]
MINGLYPQADLPLIKITGAACNQSNEVFPANDCRHDDDANGFIFHKRHGFDL